VSASPPVALSIAGSDNSAGAGIQADLKVFSACGCYGLTAVTCVVAEVPGTVSAIHPIPPKIVAEQIRLCLEAFPVVAIKTGMLYSADIIEAVAGALPRTINSLVIDPVMIASSGDQLLQDDAIEAYRQLLFPRAAVLTPNTDELSYLTGKKVEDLASVEIAADQLCSETGVPVLAKGGHLTGDLATDILVRGEETTSISKHFIRRAGSHGTGCTYSAGIASALAHGYELKAAVNLAKEGITASLAQSHFWGETAALGPFSFA